MKTKMNNKKNKNMMYNNKRMMHKSKMINNKYKKDVDFTQIVQINNVLLCILLKW